MQKKGFRILGMQKAVCFDGFRHESTDLDNETN